MIQAKQILHIGYDNHTNFTKTILTCHHLIALLIFTTMYVNLIEIVGVIAGAIMALSTMHLIQLIRYHNNLSRTSDKSKAKFFEALRNSISRNPEIGLEEIKHIHSGFCESTESNVPLGNLLQEHVYQINLEKDDGKDNLHTSKIHELIEESQRSDPYEELPSNERSVFLSISNAINFGNSQQANSELERLKTQMVEKIDTIRKLEKTTKWSVPLSFFSAFVAIVSLIF